jgi:glycosyltransferase involved in cell wall biosynthesis
VFHITNPFEWEVGIGPGFSICPLVVTLYDLIMLIFAQRYLAPSTLEFREVYLRRLQLLMRADRVVTISDTSRRDAIELLGLPSDQVDVIYAGVDECFKSLPDQAVIEAVTGKFGLSEHYILSVLGYHYTKNIEGAIAAYGRLSASLREEVPLVIVCQLNNNARKTLEDLVTDYGVQNQVVFTGEVRSDELVALYNGATIFFYPSRYDGFGLPVVEAMRCGAPVVTSNSSSLPEVAGDAALREDPDDYTALASALEILLTDASLRRELRARGFAQAQRFSWQRVAEKTLEAYHRAARSAPSLISAHSSRLRVAYWSPLNPCPSGISDYSEQLLLHLAQDIDIDVFVDGYAPVNEAITDHLVVHDYRAYPALNCHRPYDVNLYQMGNSPLHEYIYKALLSKPGVVVLHDYILQALIHSITAARGELEHYLDEIAYSEGPQARKETKRWLLKGKGNLYTYPLNRRIIETSWGIIVHSQCVQAKLENRGACQPITVVPQGASVLPSDPERKTTLRSSLGMDPEALVIGCFGFVAPVKRIETVVQAFSRFRAIYPRSTLLLVGKPDPEMVDYLEKASSRLGDSLWVTGYVTRDEFNRFLQVSDICVNLRYPSAGETSSTLCRAMGAGMPVLTTNLPQFAEFPDDCVWKVSWGSDEENELVAYLLELASHPLLRQRMGRNAQNYVAQFATWSRVAEHYLEFMEQIVCVPNRS